MSERWARALLTGYRWVGAMAYPVVGGYVAWRATKGKEDPARRRERYGMTNVMRPPGPLIWVHAASVGETLAVAPLVDRIRSFGIQVVLTTGTVTSASVVKDRFGDRVIHQYVPLDLKPAVNRFLSHWEPDLAIIAESEIWPVTILELGARRVPQILVNGRLSDRTFESWRKRSFVAEALFENMAHVVAQSEKDGERFSALGARPVTVVGNLKGDTEPLPVNEADLAILKRQIGDRPTWAAISTHQGEEDAAVSVHRLLRSRHKNLLSIIVPRHPDRADQLEAEFKARGLNVVRRSSRRAIAQDTDILLGDTIGEMGLYLRLTEIAFVGKSLTGEGGQNPLEPALLDTAVLSGTNVQNFREAYKNLVDGGGARFVKDGDMLAGAVNFLLANPGRRREMMAAGKATVERMRGALNATLTAIEPYVQPLIVKARLEQANGRKSV